MSQTYYLHINPLGAERVILAFFKILISPKTHLNIQYRQEA